jgi:hypothetical protein
MNQPNFGGLGNLVAGDQIRTGLLWYRVVWAYSNCTKGVLIATRWGDGWRDPATERQEEDLHMDSGNWERVPAKERH